MSAWAKVHWDYNLAKDNTNSLLADQYNYRDFAATRPKEQTYVVELTIRRDRMSHTDFVSLGTMMNVPFSQAFANKIAKLSGVERPNLFVNTSTATSTCSPGSSKINVLITLTAMGFPFGFGQIEMWLGSSGTFITEGFEDFLRMFLANKSYKIEGVKYKKTFHIRA